MSTKYSLETFNIVSSATWVVITPKALSLNQDNSGLDLKIFEIN